MVWEMIEGSFSILFVITFMMLIATFFWLVGYDWEDWID